MSFAPIAFTGISTFSSDFQTVLTRAVSIASLPLKKLQNDDSDILQKKSLLSGLNAAIDSLGASITSLGTIAANKALVATSSNPAKVSVVNTGAAASTTYTISDITSVAKSAAETSLTGYADSTTATVSITKQLSLTIGAVDYPITLTDQTNNLVGLRDAINALGVGVTSSILTTGTGPAPNYLSVSANNSGATTLQLHDDPAGANTSLLSASNQGANAVFTLNGVAISKPGNLVNDVIAGATFTILGATTGAETVSLSLATDRSRLSTALSEFAGKYNALVDEVGAQVGPAAGLLSGDFIVREIQNTLRQLTSFQSTGAIGNLSDLGLQLSSTGKITLDSTVFNALPDSKINDSFSFLGSTTGFGSLAAKLTQLSDPVIGLVKLQQDNYDQADKRIQRQIADLSDRITEFQTSVSQRLQAADALLAGLDSQQRVLDGTLKGLFLALYGKNPG